ncbi:hypothetical protein MCUN1_001822 [Malassezia cuniculi]|uniref:Uncharacterized protein n=1 Tax=Malassezia cuniculi TaxID=948313 RepID=A0AAF0EVA0_9BASI|nr:hypothetical protein MCUN1_001822 [Malassezia cuniculi]
MDLHQKVDDFAASIGVPPDNIKLVSCLLFSWAVAPLLPLLPSPNAKHLANIGLSLFFLVGVLRLYEGTVQLLATALLVYVMVKFRIGGKNMPWFVFVVQMSHMTYTHIHRQIADIPRTTLEISAMQMVLCMNLTTFAWDCYDGGRPIEKLDAEQAAVRIEKLPSLIEFYGYCFFFPGVLVGPSNRYANYKAWSTGALYGYKMPNGRLAASLVQLAIAVVSLIAVAVIAPSWQYDQLIDPKHPVSSAPFLQRVLHMQLSGFAARFPYYGAWSLANAGCIMSGMGYNGLNDDGKPRWNRCANLDIPAIEFANNIKELADAWNINTSVWLRNYVYKRVTPPGKNPGAASSMITFLVSALWHGLYPGYFYTFVYLGFLQQTAKLYRKAFRPVFYENVRTPNPSFTTLANYSPAQLAYSTAGIIVNQLALNFAAAPFMVLTMIDSTRVYNAVYWYGVIGVLVSLGATQLGFIRFMRQFHIKNKAQ